MNPLDPKLVIGKPEEGNLTQACLEFLKIRHAVPQRIHLERSPFLDPEPFTLQ